MDVDAHAILSTPIRGTRDDAWAWELKRYGLYMVRLAYQRIYDDQWQQMEEDLASWSGDITWKRIWRMCVPLKVQGFWWRVVSGFLPTKGILHRRHIESIANCDVCGAAESIKHVLTDCTVAKYCWDQAKVLTSVKVPTLAPSHLGA